MSKTSKKLRFEDALTRLDQIVEALESGEIGLEESLARYEEAMALAAHCRHVLDQAEQRIQRIQLDARGLPQVVPFQPGESGTPGATRAADEPAGPPPTESDED